MTNTNTESGMNKEFSLKFLEVYHLQQSPEEHQGIQRSKRYDHSKEDAGICLSKSVYNL